MTKLNEYLEVVQSELSEKEKNELIHAIYTLFYVKWQKGMDKGAMNSNKAMAKRAIERRLGVKTAEAAAKKLGMTMQEIYKKVEEK